MNYDFHTLYSTDTAFNCDVTSEGKHEYMGRLYILAAEEPTLLNLGIEKEWFLDHSQGQFLVCGHINTNGQWSLSSYKSLEPSLRYTSQSQIFDRVFSIEYVTEVLQMRNEIATELQEPILLNSGASDSDESSDVTETKSSNSLLNNEITNIANLDILKDLLLHMSPVELQEFEEANSQLNTTKAFTIEEAVTITMPQESVSQVESIPTKLEKAEVLEIQDALIEKVIENYQKENTSELILPHECTIILHAEEDYFVLLSSGDGHTIVSATMDGEVLDELKEVDARIAAFILQQFEAPQEFENLKRQALEAPVELNTQNLTVNELSWD
ncbi:hypothetical protein CAL7716_082640 [Calothrix sp. PCC 7716]|nr:hypothetical protein CAL7716_082640 [Calothrix sp. PCC 7716]